MRAIFILLGIVLCLVVPMVSACIHVKLAQKNSTIKLEDIVRGGVFGSLMGIVFSGLYFYYINVYLEDSRPLMLGIDAAGPTQLRVRAVLEDHGLQLPLVYVNGQLNETTVDVSDLKTNLVKVDLRVESNLYEQLRGNVATGELSGKILVEAPGVSAASKTIKVYVLSLVEAWWPPLSVVAFFLIFMTGVYVLSLYTARPAGRLVVHLRDEAGRLGLYGDTAEPLQFDLKERQHQNWCFWNKDIVRVNTRSGQTFEIHVPEMDEYPVFELMFSKPGTAFSDTQVNTLVRCPRGRLRIRNGGTDTIEVVADATTIEQCRKYMADRTNPADSEPAGETQDNSLFFVNEPIADPGITQNDEPEPKESHLLEDGDAIVAGKIELVFIKNGEYHFQ